MATGQLARRSRHRLSFGDGLRASCHAGKCVLAQTNREGMMKMRVAAPPPELRSMSRRIGGTGGGGGRDQADLREHIDCEGSERCGR
jgi:hypothetical protein